VSYPRYVSGQRQGALGRLSCSCQALVRVEGFASPTYLFISVKSSWKPEVCNVNIIVLQFIGINVVFRSKYCLFVKFDTECYVRIVINSK